MGLVRYVPANSTMIIHNTLTDEKVEVTNVANHGIRMYFHGPQHYKFYKDKNEQPTDASGPRSTSLPSTGNPCPDCYAVGQYPVPCPIHRG